MISVSVAAFIWLSASANGVSRLTEHVHCFAVNDEGLFRRIPVEESKVEKFRKQFNGESSLAYCAKHNTVSTAEMHLGNEWGDFVGSN